MTLKELRDQIRLDANIYGDPMFPDGRLTKIVNDAQKYVQTELATLGLKAWEASNALTLSDTTYAGQSVKKADVDSSNFPNLLKTPGSIHRIVCDDAGSFTIDTTGTYDTDGGGDIHSLKGDQTVSPNLYYYKGIHERTYLMWGTFNTTNTTSVLTAYDHRTKSWLPEFTFPEPADNDSHNHGGFIITNDGYIVASMGTQDDGDVKIYKSDAKEDISSFTLKATIGTSSKMSYHHFWKDTDTGDLYYSGRSDFSYIKVWKSTDNGETWSEIGDDIAQLSPTYPSAGDFWAYHVPSRSGASTDWKYIAINARKDDPTFSFQYIFIIKTKDFQTYCNMSESWSKDVVNDGTITQTELETNAILAVDATDETSYLRADSISINENGYPIVFGTDGVFKGGVAEDEYQIKYVFMKVWNGNSWERKELVDSSGDYFFAVPGSQGDYTFNINKTLTFGAHIYSDGTIDVYGKKMYGDTGSGDGIQEAEIWRSEDGGENWTQLKQLTTSSTYELGRGIFVDNSQDTPYQFAAWMRKTADASYDIEYSIRKFTGNMNENYGIADEVSANDFFHYSTNSFMTPTWGGLGGRTETFFAWINDKVYILPSDVKNATAHYQKVVSDLSDASDETEIPAQYQYMIVKRALVDVDDILNRLNSKQEALNQLRNEITSAYQKFRLGENDSARS